MIVRKVAAELAVGDVLVNDRVGSPYPPLPDAAPTRVVSVRKGEAVHLDSMETRPAIFYTLELRGGTPSRVELWLWPRSEVEVEVPDG